MKYFIIFTLLAFLCVMGWLPVLRYMIGSDYWDGLRVIPIVMAAEIMMGIYFNLSFWYKLIDKTIYGALFSLAGCLALLAVNIWGIPHYSYMACRAAHQSHPLPDWLDSALCHHRRRVLFGDDARSVGMADVLLPGHQHAAHPRLCSHHLQEGRHRSTIIHKEDSNKP